LINAVIINQCDMSKEYLDLKFIYHYDEQRDHEREQINHIPHISYYSSASEILQQSMFRVNFKVPNV
jgi:hypothetical protein